MAILKLGIQISSFTRKSSRDKSTYKHFKYLVVAATAALIVAVVLILSPRPPLELGLQVEHATYDPSTGLFRVYGTIEYEIPAYHYVGICLTSIKDGNRTIDVKTGFACIELGVRRIGQHWAVSYPNVKLESKTLQITISYVVNYHGPGGLYTILAKGTKQFTVEIN